jgi:DNA recombination protein Rad52
MTFSAEQKAALNGALGSSHVKQREQGGRKVSYIEGWHAIAEANRIFGFDTWSRETVELKCVSEVAREIGQYKNPGYSVTYIARVRVTVSSDVTLGRIIREGSGAGHGIDRDVGHAHESAIKEAETDAMKRALMTFGNPFGLALYDKDKAGVVNDAQPRQGLENFGSGPPVPSAPMAQSAPMLKQVEDIKRQMSACLTPTELDALKQQPEFKHTVNGFTAGLQQEIIKHGKTLRAKMTPLIMAG